MGRTVRFAFTAIALTSVAASAAAQSTLTEEEFLGALREGHPALVATTERLAVAEGARAGAGRLSNPRLAASWELPEETTQQSTWSVAWVPPLDGRRGLRVRASEAALEAASADVALANLGAREAMRAVFAAWAVGSERQRLTTTHLDKVQRLVSQMNARAESGEESGLAAGRLRLVAVELEAVHAQAAAEEASARRRASAWSTEAEGASPVLPDLPEAPLDFDIDLASPSIRARESELAQAEYEARLAGRFLVFPELEAGWQTQEDIAGESFSGPIFGAAWTVPLFDRQQGDRAQADRRLAAARAQLEFTTTMARAEFEAAREAYTALRQSALASIASVTEADALVDAASASYTAGESSLTDLLETLRSVLATRLATLDLYSAALDAHRNLEAAAGQPLVAASGGR
jgi:outer membrane protein TolC